MQAALIIAEVHFSYMVPHRHALGIGDHAIYANTPKGPSTLSTGYMGPRLSEAPTESLPISC